MTTMETMSVEKFNKFLEEEITKLTRLGELKTIILPGLHQPTLQQQATVSETKLKQHEGTRMSLYDKNHPKPKTDDEWEAVARNNKCDAEVSALLRLLDLERFKVKELQILINNPQMTVLINKEHQPTPPKQHDWTAHSHNPTAPLIPYE